MNHYQRIQRGRGLGVFFKNILKIFFKAAPIIKKVATNPAVKKIGKQALGSALSVGADVLSGANAKDSAKKELDNTKTKVGKVLKKISENIQNPKTVKRKSTKDTPIRSKKRRTKIENRLF